MRPTRLLPLRTAAGTLAALLVLAGCSSAQKDQTAPAPAVASAPQTSSGALVSGVPMPPRAYTSLGADSFDQAVLRTVSCFYAWDTAKQKSDADAYLQCAKIMTPGLAKSIGETDAGQDATPQDVDWSDLRDKALSVLSVTATIDETSGHDDQDVEDLDKATTAYRRVEVQLEMGDAGGASDDDGLDFEANVVLTRAKTSDQWKALQVKAIAPDEGAGDGA